MTTMHTRCPECQTPGRVLPDASVRPEKQCAACPRCQRVYRVMDNRDAPPAQEAVMTYEPIPDDCLPSPAVLRAMGVEAVPVETVLDTRNPDTGTFPVCAERCAECLFSPERIVAAPRAAEVVRECLATDTTFACHKGTIVGRVITCRGFWDAYPGVGQLRRIAERLGVVRFVPVPEPPEYAHRAAQARAYQADMGAVAGSELGRSGE